MRFPIRQDYMDATATQLKAVDVSENGVHATFEPNKPVLVNEYGEPVVSAKGWMVKLADKANETIPASKGFIALVGVVPSALMLLITIGAFLIGFGRADQTQTEKINQGLVQQEAILKAVERMEGRFQNIEERLRQQEIQSAKIDGFKLGVQSK